MIAAPGLVMMGVIFFTASEYPSVRSRFESWLICHHAWPDRAWTMKVVGEGIALLGCTSILKMIPGFVDKSP
jgi:hypothetical protein